MLSRPSHLLQQLERQGEDAAQLLALRAHGTAAHGYEIERVERAAVSKMSVSDSITTSSSSETYLIALYVRALARRCSGST